MIWRSGVGIGKLLFLGLWVVDPSAFQVRATHIMGGEVCYAFVGYVNSTTVRYRIRACFYRDPSGISCGQTETFGIYLDVPGLPLVQSVSLPLSTDWVYPPPQAPGCNFNWTKPSVQRCCYEGYVDLPVSTVGYHIIGSSCCRPGDVDNIVNPGSTGFVWYNYIPPTFYENTSPCFIEPAVPWLCAGDTICFSNSAYEPDGDELIYRLVDPWGCYSAGGGGIQFDAGCFGPANFLAGYDSLHPFGPWGYAFINNANGTTCFSSPNPGEYVVTIEIQEYRNGVLISRTRRDYEVLVAQCPPNDPPRMIVDSVEGIGAISAGSTFYVTEGDTLCIPIATYDPNGDSVVLEIYPASIFNPAVTQPPAQIVNSIPQPWPDKISIGSGDTAYALFCWTPCAGSARSAPYNFSVSARDVSCPSKQTTFIISIFVQRFEFPPDSIVGPEVACLYAPAQYTTVDTTYNYTYEWYVLTGGQIIGSDSDRVVTIQWDTVPPHVGHIMVIRRLGPCRTDTLYKFIYLDSAGTIPVVIAPDPMDLCLGDTGILQVAYDSMLSYTWAPDTLILGRTDSYLVVLSPDTPGIYEVYVEVTLGQCRGEDSATVRVHPNPAVNTIPDTIICEGTVLQLFAWGADFFSWTPDSFLQFSSADPDSSSPYARPDTTITYVVTGYTRAGCKDTASVTIYVDPRLVIDAQPDTIEIPPGVPVAITTTVYQGIPVQWKWTPSIWLNATNIPNPTATPEEDIVYVVEARSAGGCIARDTVLIRVIAPIYVPNAFTPNGDGVNDLFRVRGGAGIQEFLLQIFNRWGELVFETTDIQQGWDGTYRGKPQPPGTYAFYVRAVFTNGEVFEQKGSLHLIR